jgi:four helix bundle protein
MINTLEDFKTYNFSMEIGEEIWNIVLKWGYFEKDTVGKQLVKAADSIAANLSEGLGRYHFKETKNFAYYSRGSLFETKTWLTKALNRKLIMEEQFVSLISRIEEIGRMINGYITSIGSVSEPSPDYYLDNLIPNP